MPWPILLYAPTDLLLPIGAVLIVLSLVLMRKKRRHRAASAARWQPRGGPDSAPLHDQTGAGGRRMHEIAGGDRGPTGASGGGTSGGGTSGGGVRRDLEELMVEVEQLARRLGSQLDNKARRLEMLIAEADRRIARLGQLQAGPVTPDGAAGSSASPTASRSPAAAQGPAHAGDQVAASATAQGAASSSTWRRAEPPDHPLSRQVWRLAAAGKDAASIAAELDEHEGKIELILALAGRGISGR